MQACFFFYFIKIYFPFIFCLGGGKTYQPALYTIIVSVYYSAILCVNWKKEDCNRNMCIISTETRVFKLDTSHPDVRKPVLLTQYCAGDKIEKNEMGWACGAYG